MKIFFKIFLVIFILNSTVFALSEEIEVETEVVDDVDDASVSEDQVEEVKGKRALSGEIELDLENKNVDRYSVTQNFVIDGFKEAQEKIENLISKQAYEEGEFSKGKFVFSDSDLLYFASAYLYCVSKKGTCPYMLDALLEVDFLALCNEENGSCQKPKKVACANMTRMWKTWIDNDLEQRLSHSIPIGLMGKYNNFKQNGFSKYLKCSRTLLPRIKDALRDKTYLGREYSDKKEIESFSKTTQYLTALKDNVSNIIVLQGIE